MKKCLKCGEAYPDSAGICKHCYVDLDTGEILEVDENIDIDKLKKRYKEYENSVKFFLIAMFGLSFVSFFVGIVPVIPFFVLFCLVVFLNFRCISKLCVLSKILGNKPSLLFWITTTIYSVRICRKAKEILQLAEKK